MSPDADLDALIAAELSRPAPEGVHALVEGFRQDENVAAVLFYGSCRRDGNEDGLFDLYVLTDGGRALLPPTVRLARATMPDGRVMRAKVAEISRDQFWRRLRAASLDTTIWARFCQPSTLVYARDEAVRDWARQAVRRALATAALWAARLGPEEAAPADYWRLLFARTFGAELRAERGDRPARIHAAAAAWFDAVLAPSMRAAGLKVTVADGRLRPGARGDWRLAWALRRVCGKTLNLLRLIKAGATFEGGADYLAWKISRHSGERIELTEWQRRNPLLAAPAMLWRLYRRGAVR
jgi:hypothetical protein